MASETSLRLLVAVEQLVPLAGSQPQPVKGLARVTLPLGREWRYGDRILLWGGAARA